MIAIVEKVQVKAMKYIFSQSLHKPSWRKHCHSVILSVYCSRVDAKAFGWASMIPLSHLSFAQGGQVKYRPKKKVIIKVSHSVVVEGTVCVGGGWGCGRGAKAVRHDRNFCNFFNLNNFTVFNKA